MAGPHLIAAGVEQQKAARAIGVLGFAGGKAGLTHQGRLLVAQGPAHRHPGTQGTVRRGVTPGLGIAGGNDARQGLAGDVQHAQDIVRPLQIAQAHEHGAAGVGHVGDIGPPGRTAGELPDEPSLHGAHERAALFQGPAGPGHPVQQPGHLGAAEVGGHRQAGCPAKAVRAAIARQLAAEVPGAGALPYDGVVQGLTVFPVPKHRGFALVGDAHGRQVRAPQPSPGQGLPHHRLGVGPYLQGVVFHPAGMGKYLPVLPPGLGTPCGPSGRKP